MSVAIDSAGRLFYSDQLVTENDLKKDLRLAVAASKTPLTLVIQADQYVTYGELVHIALLAREEGITNFLLAAEPRLVASPTQP